MADWNYGIGRTSSILLVDDHPLMRAGLAARLAAEPDLKVIGEAASESEALELLRQGLPDLAIIDISLRDSSGLDLVRQIRARGSACKVLVISGFRESIYGERALRAGALGYLNKQETDDRLLEAVRSVLEAQFTYGMRMTHACLTKGQGMIVNRKQVHRKHVGRRPGAVRHYDDWAAARCAEIDHH